MVFVAGVLAALFIGLGWVLQQRVAAEAALSELLSFRLLLHLLTKPMWLLGVGAMVTGGLLGGWALRLGSVTLVEPLLSTNLLFAFLFSALIARLWPDRHEILGAALLSAALGVFIAIGNPRSPRSPHWSFTTAALAIAVTGAVAFLLVGFAKRRTLLIESAVIATAAGVLYGLQDAATRATFLSIDRHGVAMALTAAWPYVVVATATFGILFSQSAFRAARLDYSLPPTAAAEPVVGILLGVTVLGDRLSVSPPALAAEALCLIAMVVGVVLIGRSGSLRHVMTLPHVTGGSAARSSARRQSGKGLR
jgi:hypothetical protein